MSDTKGTLAVEYFQMYNCAQSVLAAYAGDFGLEKEKALQIAVGLGGGMGRHQDVCGAVSGAILVLGLASRFKEEDRRPKINEVYGKVHSYINDFKAKYGCVDCLDLLEGCNLNTEEGQKRFRENNMREKCWDYTRFCCDLLDKYLSNTPEKA